MKYLKLFENYEYDHLIKKIQNVLTPDLLKGNGMMNYPIGGSKRAKEIIRRINEISKII